MLLIAQPKSASTSFIKTIGLIAGIDCKLGIPRMNIDIDCEGYKYMQGCHTNMVERSPIFIKQCLHGRKTIFREHILPTDRHIKILNRFSTNFVILLRNPADSVDCYKRMKIKNCSKIEKELSEFNERYMHYASNKKHVLVIYFEDLITNYREVMTKVMRHYGIRGKIIPMLKLKYTGVGRERLKNNATDSTT